MPCKFDRHLLINVSRGSVADEDALVAALSGRRLGGAGLDVVAHEPNVPQTLLSWITSCSSRTRRAPRWNRGADLVLGNLDAQFAGSEPLTPAALERAPACERIVFETGRMAPMHYHGLSQLGLPIVCIESRQAYQALKSLATHKTDRNDARGLAHLARTGFFKPVHVKSLSAHALRSLIIARKKLVGQRVTLENQIRGLAVVFGVRLPRALTAAFISQALRASEGITGLSAAMRGLIAARAAVLAAVAAIDADVRQLVRASTACRRLMTIPGVGKLTALAFTAAVDDPGRFRRSRDIGAYLGLVPRRYQSGEVDYAGSISKCGDRRVRTLLYEAANVMLTRYKPALKLKDWAFAIAKRSTMRKARIALARRLAIIMHAMLRDGTEFNPA